MKNYQVYKRHHNNKFIGWEVGYTTEEKKGKLVIERLKPLATFYGTRAKTRATYFCDAMLLKTSCNDCRENYS